MKKIHIVLSFIVITLTGFGLSCKSGNTAREPLSIGTTIREFPSLIVIAEEQGFFETNRIDLTHKVYPSGVAALDGMFKGEVDMATGSEVAFAGNILSGHDLCTMGSISRSSIEHLVARSDRGILSLTDLEGKAIGVPMGSRPEFALDRFLLFNGIDADAVTLVNVPVNKSVDALVNAPLQSQHLSCLLAASTFALEHAGFGRLTASARTDSAPLHSQ